MCGHRRRCEMATNLELDDNLIKKAQNIGGHKTKKEAVTQALIEYIRHREQEKILSLFGTIDYDSDYNYKKHRQRQ